MSFMVVIINSKDIRNRRFIILLLTATMINVFHQAVRKHLSASLIVLFIRP